jgi:hypothetical protein
MLCEDDNVVSEDDACIASVPLRSTDRDNRHDYGTLIVLV